MIILGKNGQLAKAFAEVLGTSAVFAGHNEIDLTQPHLISNGLDRIAQRCDPSSPRVLINTAAYTNVDLAESERDAARHLNTEAPGVSARWAQANEYLLVHYSTDFVYSGEGAQPWQEENAGKPLNYYGTSKLEGEERVREATPAHLIFRTSWLYGEGNNFPRAMLALANSREKLQVVSDQVGAPTSTEELVRCSLLAVRKVLANSDGYGTYNLANAGVTTKFAFAKHAVEAAFRDGLVAKLPAFEAVQSNYFLTPAERPKNSRLSLERFVSQFGEAPLPWEKSFAKWLQRETLSVRKTPQ